MSFESTEISVNSGKPVELYEFQVGAVYYRYTSGPEEVKYNSYTFVPEIIQRGDIELTDDSFKNELELKINRDNTFFQTFIQSPIDGLVSLTIYRGHGSDFITYWAGRVANVAFNSEEITVLAIPKTSGLKKVGVRRKYQKLCNYALYELGCGVNNTSYRVTSTIATVSGYTITSAVFATKPDGWFTAGKFVLGDAERLITSHVGSTITLNRAIVGAIAGNSFYAYAGCDHTMATCRVKFNNLINYGGQPWIPNKNPFMDGSIV